MYGVPYLTAGSTNQENTFVGSAILEGFSADNTNKKHGGKFDTNHPN